MRSSLFALVLSTGVVAQEPETAAQVTELSRSMDRALDIVLGGRGRKQDAVERCLFVLLDASPSLKKSAFASKLGAALQKHAGRLGKTRIGLGRVGFRGVVVVEPTRDHALVLRGVEAELARPSGAIQNIYADVRTLSGKLAGKPGKREILLVTLENGDAEDDVDATAAQCKKNSVAVTVLTTEAYLSDCYWRGRGARAAPRGTTLTGGDNPYIDLPYGWLFQKLTANEITPSGYACYGINRVAAQSSGRVFLYAPKSDTRHRCAIHASSTCLFCSGDHLPEGESYMQGRMSLFAPTTKSRKRAFRDAAADPCTRDVLVAWRDASKSGLLRSGPPLKLAGTSTRPDRNRRGRNLNLFTLGFERNAAKAIKAGKECDRIIARLTARLEKVQKYERSRANAELTRVLLQVTKTNLTCYAAWCREIAPRLTAKNREEPAPPERLEVALDRRPRGVDFTNMCLCHGVKPFLNIEMPGGKKMRAELVKLDALVTSFMARYGHTPYAVALHRTGLARFHFTYPGKVAKGSRKRPKSKGERPPQTETPRNRPNRGGSSAGASGPTTGKE